MGKTKIDHFELISECNFYEENSLQVYKSCKTGLHVIIASVDGPVVNGFYAIATEETSDDGLPHTLEHLIFLGSEEYPYKGVLDLLANRCLAEGTNAWTSTDHTAYTIMTAGSEGFLNLLPIYLDHILYPTLTEAAFVTEVYHITGKGTDAGVVYSEMQGCENSAFSRTYLEMMRILYPEGCGYRYETGGIMANFRNSTTIEKIRNFHKAAYQPENLYVIMTGQLDPQQVFKALQPFEEKIISKGKGVPFARPWQSPVPPFSHSITKSILYPSDSEDTGMVCAAWRGPSIVHHLKESLALEVLLEYLTHSSISPLPKAFVEREDPFASEVSNYFLKFSETGAALSFEGVPYKKIIQIADLLRETLQRIVTGSLPFDLDAMRNILNNQMLDEINKMESDPHRTLAESIINYTLYGNDSSYLNTVVNLTVTLEQLCKEDSPYWLELLKKYLVNGPMLVINAMPSIKESEKLKEEVKTRVDDRKEHLGKDGLKKLQDKLESAQRINEIPVPDELLSTVPVASAENLSFHSLVNYSNLTNTSGMPQTLCPFLDTQKVPFKIELDHIKSNFVQLTAKLDLSTLNNEHRLYLPLLSELLLESPIKRNVGSLISHEEVVKQLHADTLFVNVLNGISFYSKKAFSYGNYFSNLAINMKVSVENFAKGIQWMKDILFNVVIDADRVKVKINKLINSIGEHKRDGFKMVHLLHNKALFSRDATVNRGDFLVQEKFLNKILLEMQTDPTATLEALREVYKKVTCSDCFSLHLAANLQGLTSSVDLLKLLQEFPPDYYAKAAQFNLSVVPDCSDRLPLKEDSPNTGYIIGLGSIESSFLYQTTSSLNDFCHEDLPALMVAIAYFTQIEGPLWKQVRGQGLAYGYRILLKPSEGTLTLVLAKAAQLVEAYKVTLKLMQSYLGGSETWSQLLYESAKSSSIYEVIQREADISDVVQQSLLSYYRKVPQDYNRNLIKKISDVTLEGMKAATLKYMTPLLSSKQTVTVVVCQTSNVDNIQRSFQSFDHNLTIIDSLENSWISQI